MILLLVVTCAGAATTGAGLLALAVAPRRRSLAVELDALLGTPSTGPAASFWDALGDAIWRLVPGTDGGDRLPVLMKDLAATGETPAVLVRQVVTTAATFIGLALGVCTFVALEGLHPATSVEIALVVLAGLVGAVVPRATLRSQAVARRAEMREAVAVICDLAAVLVAAGEDVDAALADASGAGEGWAFEAIGAALPIGGRLGTWVALEALGEHLGVEELVVLAQNMGLAEEKGAKVRDALNTQAKTLREEAASEVEAKAGSMTERMSFPMVMLLAGFLLVIGYPAVARL